MLKGGLKTLFYKKKLGQFSKILQIPSISDSITEVTVLRYFKKVGEYIKKDEELVEVESHKGSINIRATESGKILKLILPLNSDAVVGADLVEIDETVIQPVKEVKIEPRPDEKVKKVELKPQKQNIEEPQSVQVKSVPLNLSHNSRSETRERLSRIRKTAAERLKHSQNSYASVCTFQEVDMSRVIEMRKELGEDFKTRFGVKLGIMPFFIKASAVALKERPYVNAVIDDSTNEILFRNYVDISVAVSGPKGLLVPVIKDCQGLNFLQIEQRLADFTNRAKLNTINIEEMSGGTFTISNGGVFGSMLSVPIINPPQSAILGMHNIVNRPVVREGEIVARPIMYLSLSYDHRLLDGREGVGFLRRVTELLEDPRKFLYD